MNRVTVLLNCGCLQETNPASSLFDFPEDDHCPMHPDSGFVSIQYESLNDAGGVGDEFFAPTNKWGEANIVILYARRLTWIETYEKAFEVTKDPENFELRDQIKADLSKTHAVLGSITASFGPYGGTASNEAIWSKMQGERWSPNGEARKLVTEIGHTSMSVGDVLLRRVGSLWGAWMVAPVGFVALGRVQAPTTGSEVTA